MKSSRRFNNGLVAIIALVLVLAIALLFVEARRIRGFIDENTGSQKGYSEWFFGIRTGEWYQASALESFMRKTYPADLHQEWISYQGDMYTIYGTHLGRGHGRPGLIKNFGFNPEIFGPYCAKTPAADIKKLYDALESKNQTEIEKFVEPVFWEYNKAAK